MDFLYSLRALNLAIFISFALILVLYSIWDSSSFSSFPKNLFNNLLEKISADEIDEIASQTYENEIKKVKSDSILNKLWNSK